MPTPTGPRDLTQSCSSEELLGIRQRGLELAHSRPRGGLPESDAERRCCITADAAAFVEFILAGKIATT